MYVLALRIALSHLKQKPFARLVVVASVSCILLINAVVFLMFQSLSTSLAEVRAAKFMTAYIDSSVSPARESDVLSAVRKIPGVGSAQLVSRDAFLSNFSKYFPQLSNELSTLDPDTVPRYVKIKVNSEREVDVQNKLQSLRGIEMVELNQNRYSGLIGALTMLRRLALILIAGMSTALICILLNHFKLGSAFQAQVKTTMQVLGAKKSQALVPFAFEGFLEGACGGLLAAGALMTYGRLFEGQMNEMFSAIGYHPYHFQLFNLSLGLAAVGMLSGTIGSLWAAMRVSKA